MRIRPEYCKVHGALSILVGMAKGKFTSNMEIRILKSPISLMRR